MNYQTVNEGKKDLVVVEDNPTFKKDTWYHILIEANKICLDGQKLNKEIQNIQFNVIYSEDTEVNYDTIFSRCLRFPKSFWKMYKQWRQFKRLGLCR